MEHHEKIWAAHDKYNEKNDCAVAAVAYATGEEYEKVHKVLEKRGRKPCDGAHLDIILEAVKDLGYSIEEAFQPPEFAIKLGLTPLGSFIKFTADTKPGKYLVLTPKHILAIANDHVFDTGGTSMKAPVLLALKLAEPVVTEAA